MQAAAQSVQKRVRGASAAATDQQTWHTQAPMTQEDRQLPSGAEAVAQRVGDSEVVLYTLYGFWCFAQHIVAVVMQSTF